MTDILMGMSLSLHQHPTNLNRVGPGRRSSSTDRRSGITHMLNEFRTLYCHVPDEVRPHMADALRSSLALAKVATPSTVPQPAMPQRDVVEPYLSLRQTARMCKVGNVMVQEGLACGELFGFKEGNMWRILPYDARQWMQSRARRGTCV